MAYYRKDQLSIKTRKLLADYLADLILIADSIQSFRVALAQTPAFNGIQLFRFLDQQQKGYLTPKDFTLLVSDQGKKILHYAFGWFDISKVGQITRTEFLQFLFPRRNLQLRAVVSERMIQQMTLQTKGLTLPFQTDLLRGLILQLMQKQVRLIPLRRSLMDQEDYTIKAVMNCLDVEGRGWITTGDLYKFLKNFDIDVIPSVVCQMLGVYDNDLNGKIQMGQLQWLIEGLQRGDSNYRNIVRNSDKKAESKLKKSRCVCHKVRHQSASKQKVGKKATQQYKIYTAVKARTGGKNESENQKGEYTKQKNQPLKQVKYENSNKNRQEKQDKKQHGIIIQQFSEKSHQKNNMKQFRQQKQFAKLKSTFLALEQRTQNIDYDLIKIQQELNQRTLTEMQKQLENAKIRRSLKNQHREIMRRSIEQMEVLKRQAQIKRIREEEERAHYNRKIVQIEMQRARYEADKQKQKYEVQKQKLRLMELQRQQQYALQKAKLKRKMILQNEIALSFQQSIRKDVHFSKEKRKQGPESKVKIEDKEITVNKNERAGKSLNEWSSQARKKTIEEDEIKNIALSRKEAEYIQRYKNYCHNLALIEDPLGIKKHLEDTDKFLIRSRQLRDQIKKDRANSTYRFSNNKQESRDKGQEQTEKFEVTPKINRNIQQATNKKTEQTKLGWSGWS